MLLQVDEGMKIVTEEKCDCIISFGGGSPHDAAKGIAVLATNGGKAACLSLSAEIVTDLMQSHPAMHPYSHTTSRCSGPALVLGFVFKDQLQS